LIGGVVAEAVGPWVRDPAMLVPIAAIAGGLAVVPMAVTVLVLLLRGHFFTRLEALAVSFHVFGIVANALIAVARAPALLAQPAQLFADVYLFWSCIAWLGLGLFVVARLPYAGPTGRRVVLIAIALFCLAMVADAAVQGTR
jgi:membrane-anchored protein YejM (alkaline phosphatase superfamily)